MLRQVRLELARCHHFPERSRDHRYELSLPLTRDTHLDREDSLKHRENACFRPFCAAQDERGQLRHARHRSLLSFAPGTDADEVIFKADQHRFAEGEYISIKSATRSPASFAWPASNDQGSDRPLCVEGTAGGRLSGFDDDLERLGLGGVREGLVGIEDARRA